MPALALDADAWVDPDHRQHDAEHSCVWCGAGFARSGRRRYCSDACKAASYRARRALSDIPRRVPRSGTVYECAGCQERQIGEQRCEECNTFAHSLGPGGECPRCGDAIAVAELLG